MAWFTFVCEKHGEFRLSLPKRQYTAQCPKCGAMCKHVFKAATMQVIERLDNGAMGRAIERLANIEEILKERAQRHSEEVRKQYRDSDDNES